MNVSKLFVEGYILSDKTLGYDMEKFYEKKASLFILGVSGSGKTTLGKKFSEKYNVRLFETDGWFDWANSEELIGITEEEYDKLSKEKRKKYRTLLEKIYVNTILSNDIIVFEGVDLLYDMFGEDKNNLIVQKIMNSSVISMGTSDLLSTYRANKRDQAIPILERIKKNFGLWHDWNNRLRDIMSSKAKTIEEIQK